MISYESKLPTYNLENQRVILRADLNVPIENGSISDDFRLLGLLPTLDFIREKKGLITLITHIGRPKNREALLSTRILIPWFERRGYHITWANDIETAQQLIKSPENEIVLLENIRFYPEEKTGDVSFAQKLSTLGIYYINDAFGAMHRSDTSITLLPQLFDSNHKTIGFLVEKELKALNKLIENPAQPFVMILGGGKVKDKLPVIENLLSLTSTILLCPAIVATFLKAQGQEVGNSLVDQTAIELCKAIVEKARKQNVEILLPIDYVIAHKTINGTIETIDAQDFPADGIALSIGPETIKLYTQSINTASTLFFNCAMGFASVPKSLQGTQLLLQALAHAQAFSVVGGGDSVAAARRSGLSDEIDFLSTGGGATLTYLSGKILPGLQALCK
jgi:phosphoglycerate kinase